MPPICKNKQPVTTTTLAQMFEFLLLQATGGGSRGHGRGGEPKVNREEFDQMGGEIQEGGGTLGDCFINAGDDSIGWVEFETALVNVLKLPQETAAWWLGLRRSGALELQPQGSGRGAAAEVFRVEAAEIIQMGTLVQMREDGVGCMVRQSLALDAVGLLAGLDLLRGDAEFAETAEPEALVRGLFALDYLQVRTLPVAVEMRLVSWATTAVASASVAAASAAASSAAAEWRWRRSEQLVEQLRQVVQLTAFGTKVWAGLHPAARLAALSLPVPLTPYMKKPTTEERAAAEADVLAANTRRRMLELPPDASEEQCAAKQQENRLWAEMQPENALMVAAMRGESTTIRQLLSGGRDELLEKQNCNGHTPLMAAAIEYGNIAFGAFNGKLEAAEALIEAGAKVDVRSNFPWRRSALWYAAHNDEPEIVELLLRHAADRTLQGKYNGNMYTAHGIAMKWGNTDCTHLLFTEE